MKHGISPTTRRNRRWEQDTLFHLSKALVQRVIDFTTVDADGRVKVQYLPLHLQAPPGAAVKIVVATYHRNSELDYCSDRPGLRRRYRLSGRELTVQRLESHGRHTYYGYDVWVR